MPLKRSLRRVWILIALALVGSACNPASPQPTVTDAAANQATLPPEPTAAPTATATPEPTATPTPVVLSDDEKQAAFSAYKTILVTELAARLSLETTNRLLSGKDVGFASLAWVITAAATAKTADDALAKITPPDVLADSFAEAQAGSAQTRDVLSRWVNKEIDAKTAQSEFGPIVERLQAASEDAGIALTQYYGWDGDALAQTRQDLMDQVPSFFETPTPTAAP